MGGYFSFLSYLEKDVGIFYLFKNFLCSIFLIYVAYIYLINIDNSLRFNWEFSHEQNRNSKCFYGTGITVWIINTSVNCIWHSSITLALNFYITNLAFSIFFLLNLILHVLFLLFVKLIPFFKIVRLLSQFDDSWLSANYQKIEYPSVPVFCPRYWLLGLGFLM